MDERTYYSIRTGRNPNSRGLNLEFCLRLFKNLYEIFESKGYFQKAFGYECIDQGYVAGSLGTDVEAYLIFKLRKEGLFPILEKVKGYSEDDLFDIIEFLFDNISKPIPQNGDYHSYSGCGWHYSKFDISSGRKEFITEVNNLIKDYSSGYQLSDDGEIFQLEEDGMQSLIDADLPFTDPTNIEDRVKMAIRKFRYRNSPLEDRRDAIRDLADVLEFLRPKMKEVISRKDESDLFIIANNFHIRHHNLDQKQDYNKPIWYSWMFYYYLSTIHAVLRLIEKYNNDNKK